MQGYYRAPNSTELEVSLTHKTRFSLESSDLGGKATDEFFFLFEVGIQGHNLEAGRNKLGCFVCLVNRAKRNSLEGSPKEK